MWLGTPSCRLAIGKAQSDINSQKLTRAVKPALSFQLGFLEHRLCLDLGLTAIYVT
jgi:hypothetical protein